MDSAKHAPNLSHYSSPMGAGQLLQCPVLAFVLPELLVALPVALSLLLPAQPGALLQPSPPLPSSLTAHRSGALPNKAAELHGCGRVLGQSPPPSAAQSMGGWLAGSTLTHQASHHPRASTCSRPSSLAACSTIGKAAGTLGVLPPKITSCHRRPSPRC